MPQPYPKSVLEFEHWFRTEDACRQHLFRLRWPHGFQCPRCPSGQAWQTQRGLWHCGGCGKDVSVTAGTIFENSKLSLRLWFRAIWWVTNQKSGVSALGLQRTLGLGSYKTAWGLVHKLRRAMIRPGREQLSGTVEVDETWVGGRRRKKWGHSEKAVVVIAVEVRGKGMGRIRLQLVPRPSRQCLQTFVRTNVAPGSAIITDGSWGYDGLASHQYDHQYSVLDHEPKEAAIRVLPRVHRIAALLKRWFLGTHQGRTSRRQMDHYLDEFAFRFNRRKSASRGMLFHRLLEGAVAIKPTRYKDIVKAPRSRIT